MEATYNINREYLEQLFLIKFNTEIKLEKFIKKYDGYIYDVNDNTLYNENQLIKTQLSNNIKIAQTNIDLYFKHHKHK